MYGSFFQSEKNHCSSIRTVISDLMLCRWSFASQFLSGARCRDNLVL